MTRILTATYDGETLRPDVALPLPPGTRVTLTLETPEPPALADAPGVGMWRDRDDLADSTAWVRTLRLPRGQQP